MHQSKTRTSLSLSRRISFVGSVFPGQSYKTTGPNLIAESIETYAKS